MPDRSPVARRARTPGGRAALLAGWWVASGCLRFGYETIGGNGELAPFDGLVSVSSSAAGAGGAAVAEPDSGAPVGGGASSGGTAEPGLDTGSTPPGIDAGHGSLDGGSAAPDAGGRGASAQACRLGNQQTVQQFDSPTPGVQARGGNATLTWTGAVGNPSAGALDFQNSQGSSAEIYSGSLTGDLSNQTMLLNVYVASGANVRVRLFAETGAQLQRGTGEFVAPPPGQWDCASLVLGAPAGSDSGYDPRNVTGAGLEVDGTGTVEIYVDQVAY